MGCARNGVSIQKMSLLGVRNIENYNQRMAEAIKKSEKIVRSIPSGINPETGQPTSTQIEIENKKCLLLLWLLMKWPT